MPELGLGLPQFEAFLDGLSVPNSCVLNKPLFKKMFQEHADLDAKDKKSLKYDVDKIRWLYTLKPNTINIAPYKDSEREYPEIAILHVELSSSVSNKKPASSKTVRRIAHFINRAIPYPLIILFTCEIDAAQNLSIVLADKRINRADKEKWVIEDSIHSYWINLASLRAAEISFFESFKINNLQFNNFFSFYQALIERLVAIKCAEHSGDYSLEKTGHLYEKASSTARLDRLRELERLEAKRSEISNKLKKIKQMGKQVELNTQIKKINDEIANIKGSL